MQTRNHRVENDFSRKKKIVQISEWRIIIGNIYFPVYIEASGWMEFVDGLVGDFVGVKENQLKGK